MNAQSLIKDLESSAEFTRFKQEHPKAVLVHIFHLLDEANKDETQIGYYEEDSGTMFTFFVKTNEIRLGKTNEVLKDPDKKINPLKIENVNATPAEVLETANNAKKTDHPKETPLKQFFILQNIEGKEVYNISFFMHSFKVFNIKISAEDGSIASKSFDSLVDMQKK